MQDSRFNKDIDTRTGYRTISVMCQPILNFQGDVIGVAQCINKVTGDHQFTDQDQETAEETRPEIEAPEQPPAKF
ncbi:GAF domain-containing protein [Caerostris extrusa]|uniref:GAF domain-containing protein n=1 Tax=Caerostris extrusa TaxID=172846 RepID=A0AAV4P2V8_CAEEX|nr:GAF domain-containing protein [Caerostris extrusa]